MTLGPPGREVELSSFCRRGDRGLEGCPVEGSLLLEGKQCHQAAQIWEQLAGVGVEGLRRGKCASVPPTAPGVGWDGGTPIPPGSAGLLPKSRKGIPSPQAQEQCNARSTLPS